MRDHRVSMCQPCKDAADNPLRALSPENDGPELLPVVQPPHPCAFPASCTCQHRGAGLMAVPFSEEDEDPLPLPVGGSHYPNPDRTGSRCTLCNRHIRQDSGGTLIHLRAVKDQPQG